MVRSGAVSQPHQLSFSLRKWRIAYSSVTKPTDEDKSLFDSGTLLFGVFEALRGELKNIHRPYLSSRIAARWVVGVSNRDYALLEHAQRQQLEAQRGQVLIPEAQLGMPLPVGPGGSPLDVVGLLGGKVDAVRFPLWDALRDGNPAHLRPNGDDAFLRLRGTLQLAGYYDAAEGVWYQCLYAGYRITERETWYNVAPHDLAEAAISAVSEHRLQALNMEMVHHAMTLWRTKPDFRKVVRHMQPKVYVNSRGRPTRLGWPEAASQPGLPLLMQVAAEEMYWESLISVPLPSLPGVSIRNLLHAWQVLACLAQSQMSAVPRDTEIEAFYETSKFAPSFSRRELLRLLEQFGLPKASCEALIDALSYPDNPSFQTDPWFFPLIRWGVDEFVVHFPVALTGNLIRCVEQWMKRYGIDLSRRGHAFEKHVRDEMTSWQLNPAIASSARVLPRAMHLLGYVPDAEDIQKTDDDDDEDEEQVDEEVDVVVVVGNLILICECKCALAPAVPGQKYRQLQRLRKAARQVQRKAVFARANLDVLAKALGHPLNEDVRIVPIIITNLRFHVGSPVDGVAVVDEHVLRRALVDGNWPLLVDGESGKPAANTDIYTTLAAAEASIPAFLLAPPYIRMLHTYVRWTRAPLPALPTMTKPLLQCNLLVDLMPLQDRINTSS